MPEARPTRTIPNSSTEQEEVLKITCENVSVLLRHEYPDVPDTSHVLFLRLTAVILWHSPISCSLLKAGIKKLVSTSGPRAKREEIKRFHNSSCPWLRHFGIPRVSPVVAQLRVYENHTKGLWKEVAGPSPNFWLWIWTGSQESVFLTSSQEMVMLLVLGRHFENDQPRKSPRLLCGLSRR